MSLSTERNPNIATNTMSTRNVETPGPLRGLVTMNWFSLERQPQQMIRPDDEQEHLRVSLCNAHGDTTAHVISTPSASRLERIRLR